MKPVTASWKGRAAAWSMAAASVLFSAGCATVPAVAPGPRAEADRQQAVAQVRDRWERRPAVRVVEVPARWLLRRYRPVPWKLRRRTVRLQPTAHPTVEELVLLLTRAGIPAAVGSEELGRRRIVLPPYRGRLGGLLETLERTADVGFEWRGGVLVAVDGYRYVARVPQDPELIQRLAQELEAYGARDVRPSLVGGTVAFTAPPSQVEALREHVRHLVRNSASVYLQVAAISVQVESERQTGIDWSALRAVVGDGLALVAAPGAGPAAGAGGAAGVGGARGAVGGAPRPGAGAAGGLGGAVQGAVAGGAAAAGTAARGVAAGLAGQQAAAVAERSRVSLNAVLKLLSTYGRARTVQDVLLRTLSGSPVKIRSGESVPYVAGVGVSTLGTAAVAGASLAAGLLGSASVSTAESGLTLEITPAYDAETGLVTLDLDLEMATILGFVQLQAGAQLGSFSQPRLRKQTFNTRTAVRAGETVVVGGLIEDSRSDDYSTLAGLENQPAGSRSRKRSRSMLFILIRPTVVRYEMGA